ncbi:MAG: hypothetical protein ACPLRA_01345, partial [Candidatus Saccharicenans sp.]
RKRKLSAMTIKKKDKPEKTMAENQGQREFSLFLPMKVSGLDAFGQEFKEDSVLSTISSEQASFLLKTKVEAKSLLKLIIPLPPKLADGQPLSMVLKGKVVSIESIAGEKASRILIQLDSRYFIGQEEGEA